jgi:hypothetical protein
MFYHRILFLSQIWIWTIVKHVRLMPLDHLHVLVWCVNPSIWYGLTHELDSTLLEHTPHVVPHVLTLQAESSLQFQIQALAKSGASGITHWKRMTKKLTQKSLHTAPKQFHTSCQVQERNRPNKWQERWCHRSEWPFQGSANAWGYPRHH